MSDYDNEIFDYTRQPFKTHTAVVKRPETIVRNRCQCSVCLDIIESKSVHDFVQCHCGRIYTDGGTEYVHRGFLSPTDIIDLTELKGSTLDKGA
jgi:hypothetical protein